MEDEVERDKMAEVVNEDENEQVERQITISRQWWRKNTDKTEQMEDE